MPIEVLGLESSYSYFDDLCGTMSNDSGAHGSKSSSGASWCREALIISSSSSDSMTPSIASLNGEGVIWFAIGECSYESDLRGVWYWVCVLS